MTQTALAVLLASAVIVTACTSAADPRADLIDYFKSQVRPCYALPNSARGSEAPAFEIWLHRNGSLQGNPKILRGSPDSAAATAALKAFRECLPFKIPEDIAARYREWRRMHIAFDTN